MTVGRAVAAIRGYGARLSAHRHTIYPLTGPRDRLTLDQRYASEMGLKHSGIGEGEPSKQLLVCGPARPTCVTRMRPDDWL